MWEWLKERHEVILGTICMIVFFGGIWLWFSFLASAGTAAANEITCKTVSVPYSTSIVDTSNVVGEETIETQGVEGQDKVCTKGSGQEVSRETIVAPVNHVIGMGRIPESEWGLNSIEPDYEEGGAICMDGWRSYSVGRGTCSHHGGVAQWL